MSYSNDKFIDMLLADPAYRVLADGTVWSNKRGKWKKLKQFKVSTHGYLAITYYHDYDRGYSHDLRISRIVYRKFVGKLDPNKIVHHIDDDKENNTPWNLELMDSGNHVGMHNTKRASERCGLINVAATG